jgi:hypothetical protein
MARFLYGSRPSKHVQRRMVVDACRRLRAFAPLAEYEYLGFGAFEFVDFELVRRELGIVRMQSIEEDTNGQARYLFNRPFAEIRMHFSRASDVLPDLLDEPVLRIVWLDYTGLLEHEVLQDVGTCIRKLVPGSVLIVTVAARPATPASSRRDRLVEAVGAERVSGDITNESLALGFAATQRDILVAEADVQATRRTDGAVLRQLFNIRYRDDNPMQTWGGVLLSPGMSAALDLANFAEMEQVSLDEMAVDATVEPLTTREVLHLNRQIPTAPGAALVGEGIPPAALIAYERLYRWYPAVPAPM